MAYTFTYRGFTFGDGSDYDITSISGLHDLNHDAPVAPWQEDHGGYALESFHGERRVLFSMEFVGEPGDDIASKRSALRRALLPVEGGDEFPLVFSLPGEPTQRLWCRSARLATPMTLASELGLATATVEFVASDPAIYSEEETVVAVAPRTPAAGLTYPVSYPKEYGPAASGGAVISNTGDWKTWPVWEIKGPTSGTLTDPIIEDLTHGRVIDLSANGGVSIGAGQTLIIDTHKKRRRIAYTTGASRYGRLTDTSELFPLPVGDTQLRWRADGDTAGATVTVRFRSARL